MSQPSVKLARRFAFDSIALAEELGSTLKLSGSRRRLFKVANERQQGSQLFLIQFFDAQRLLSALILQGYFVALTICFSAGIHAASPVKTKPA